MRDFELGFRVACVVFIAACFAFGCGTIASNECPDDGTDWYFVDCPENPMCPTAPVSLCMNGAGKVRASGCTYSGHGFPIACVARCGG